MLKVLVIAAVTTVALLTGCSKSGNGIAGAPKVAELGTVELTYDTPYQRDLGGGLVCVLTARPLNASSCELIAAIQKSGKEVASSRIGSALIDQPLSIALGSLTLNLVPHPK